MKDPWFELRRYTQARIGQGRAGCALPTSAQLEFQLAHAMARDAVHQSWTAKQFAESIAAMGWESLLLATQVGDRHQYLQRPDLGRRLDQDSRTYLQADAAKGFDVVLIVTNGLSSTAIDCHGLALLKAIMSAYASCSLKPGPVCVVPNARVALADEIGAILNTRLAIIIVGERPGLSAADSLGAYLTYAPRIGNSDAERNCLSNIRPPQGLSYDTAAAKLAYLSLQALQRGFSGVALKDDMPNNWLKTNDSRLSSS